MSWKSFSLWTKAGVVCASIFLAIAVVDLVFLCEMGTSMQDPCGFFLVMAALPIFSFTQSFGSGYSWYFGTVIVGTIFYFGVGAGICWLFSRCKSH